MNQKKYDVVVFFGRFQPIHAAHIETIKLALENVKPDGYVVIIVGSANEPRTYFKNPFTDYERIALIQNALKDNHISEDLIYFQSVENNIYSDAQWAIKVREAVEYAVGDLSKFKVAKIGFKKDKNVERDLNLFPTWDYINTPQFEPLDATHIRDITFNPKMNLKYLDGVCAPSTISFLKHFRDCPEYAQMLHEKEYIEKYKTQYASYAYPPIFVTADAVVIQSGYILMIKRRAEPGKGLWALPGGFVNANTDASVEDAMIRELMEETSVKIPEKILRKNIKHVKVFDAIDRSARGRTITHAFNIVLDDGEWNLPKVSGSDDAEEAEWIPITSLNRQNIFDDHLDIILHFLGKL